MVPSETNISHNYQYDRSTIVNVYNSDAETTSTLPPLPLELINILNSTHPLLQGSVLFEYANHISSSESTKNRKITEKHGKPVKGIKHRSEYNYSSTTSESIKSSPRTYSSGSELTDYEST